MTSNTFLSTASIDDLRNFCPLKWHQEIPENGIAMGMADIDFMGPSGVIDFLKKRLDKNFNFYGNYEGISSAIKTGQQFLKSRGISRFEKNNLQILPGTMIGIYAIMEWISRKPGEITIINPIYPPIHKHASETGNKINWVNLAFENQWHLDSEKLKENINSKTKLLVFNNPNNPTGTVFNEEELGLISDLAEEFDFPCFIDELYYPLVFPSSNHVSFASLEGVTDRTITLHGFSKTYGLAGWRSGFLYIDHPQFIEIKYIIEQLLVAPSPIASLIMEFALTENTVKEWQILFNKQIHYNIKFASNLLNQKGIECIEPEGTFFVFPKINTDDVIFRNNLLKHQGVEIVPGSEFGPAGKGFIRINCATSPENIEIGIERISKELA